MQTFRRNKPSWQTDIAKERMDILFHQALLQAKNSRFDLSNRYVFLARKIGMKFNVKIPQDFRRKFCHKCYHYLYPPKNIEIRTNKKTQAVEYKCLDCKHINRYPYVKEKQSVKHKQSHHRTPNSKPLTAQQ